MFTYKCEYNDFTSKYTDIYSLHVTQIDLLHKWYLLQYLILLASYVKKDLCV